LLGASEIRSATLERVIDILNERCAREAISQEEYAQMKSEITKRRSIVGVIKNIIKFIIIFGLLFSNCVNADIIAPDVLVKNTADEVLSILKANQSNNNNDFKVVAKLVEDKIAIQFDFDRMTRMTLGQSWRKATKEQQEQLVAEFRSLLIRTYSFALQKYQDQTIQYFPLGADRDANDVTVKTMIIQSGGPAVPIEYSLEKTAEKWNVYDVKIDGMSLVTTYRGQFSEEIKKNGIDSLIEKLTVKNKS
jgi:phospholipid transport system substrate-binding protein